MTVTVPGLRSPARLRDSESDSNGPGPGRLASGCHGLGSVTVTAMTRYPGSGGPVRTCHGPFPPGGRGGPSHGRLQQGPCVTVDKRRFRGYSQVPGRECRRAAGDPRRRRASRVWRPARPRLAADAAGPAASGGLCPGRYGCRWQCSPAHWQDM